MKAVAAPAGRRLEHDPEKACPGLDPGWVPVFGKDHAQTKKLEPDSGSTPKNGKALALRLGTFDLHETLHDPFRDRFRTKAPGEFRARVVARVWL